MKRYFLTKYGEINKIQVPDVVEAGKINIYEDYLDRNKEVYENGDIVVINRINKFNTKEFVKTILRIRKRYWEKVLYLPATGIIYDYPILFYLGVDILDDVPLRIMGDEKCITEFGIINGQDCLNKNQNEKDRILERIRLSIENNRFRELVENYSMTSFSKEALRIIDMSHYDDSEPFIDFRERNIQANSIESMYRPELQYFRNKIKELKKTADNLLLIPCSAVKPYSQSKTHKILHSRIYPYLSGIQEVIVTSPLGLVPREIENLFPAKNYDIPVTGYWFGEEKDMLMKTAKEFFKDKKYDNVFFILNEEEAGFLEIFDSTEGIKGSLNWENSDRILKIISAHNIKKDKNKKRIIEFSNVIKYLYDISLDISDATIKDEGNRSLLIQNNEKMIKKTSSGFSMEYGLAKILFKEGKRIINISGKFSGQNIYIPGILSISNDILPGNEVVLVENDEVVGRGVSEISYLDFTIQKKGIGVSDVSYFDR